MSIGSAWRPDLDEAFLRREIYLHDGIPPGLVERAIAEARTRRAQELRHAFAWLGRAIVRLFRWRWIEMNVGPLWPLQR